MLPITIALDVQVPPIDQAVVFAGVLYGSEI